MARPNWDQYFLKLAMLASERATCPRMHCGCVLVKNKNVVATGYNGSIPGDDHCEDIGCLVIDNHCVRTNHAEMNASGLRTSQVGLTERRSGSFRLHRTKAVSVPAA